jgi:Arc/MetJ-type ribon-helix-helix transcriptional regulator
MSQFNLNATPEFLADVDLVVRRRRLKSRAEAVRVAVHEAAERARPAVEVPFERLIGIAGPAQTDRRFDSDDALWRAG